MSSNRYDNTGGGAIEVISPASSPVQPQQDKQEDVQQQAPGTKAKTVNKQIKAMFSLLKYYLNKKGLMLKLICDRAEADLAVKAIFSCV